MIFCAARLFYLPAIEAAVGIVFLILLWRALSREPRPTQDQSAAKSGIKIVSETLGSGPVLKKGDRVRLTYDMQLNRGDFLFKDQQAMLTVGDRNFIAGFRYGLEGMRAGGTRRFRASPHLCYRDTEVAGIPKNAVLVCDIKNVEIVS